MSTAPRLTINLAALADNWRFLQDKSGKAEASAVIKANGYGLGIQPVANALSKAGCKTFFTAMVEEAVSVREINPDARIFVLNGIMRETIEPVREHSLVPILSSLEQISLWAGKSEGEPCAIHVDTGMNRLGLRLEEAKKLVTETSLLSQANPVMLMSHLACGDEPNDPKNREQLLLFKKAAELLPDLQLSFSNSAGIMHGEDFHFDLTRPGISLYGGEAINNVPNPMQPVVTAEARVLQVRTAPKGETVGYGAAHILDRESRIAVCSGGYADGYHRAASGSGVALRNNGSAGAYGAVDGHKIPLLGRVSMDLTAFDVTDLPDGVLDNNHWVELFGQTIAVDDAARACGTIGYELLTSLGNRYQRNYIGG